jgi:HEAT repeat protein
MKRPAYKRKVRNRKPLLPVKTRIRVLKNAAISKRPNIRAVLMRAMKDPSARVRAIAVELAAKTSDIALVGHLQRMMSDSSRLVRSEAVEAFGNMEAGTGRHHKSLVSRLGDTEPLVRIAAIESITQIQDTAAVMDVESHLADSDPLVRAYAGIALAEMGCQKCLSRILDALAKEKTQHATAGLLIAMQILGDNSQFIRLLDLLLSSQYRVRIFVANWIPRLNLNNAESMAAKKALQRAIGDSLGRADASTMSAVLRQIGPIS